MARFKFALIAIGGVLAFLGYKEMSLSSQAKPEAQTLSVDELAASGYGENAHVELKDFILCGWSFVYREGSGGEAYNTVWIPIVSMNDPEVVEVAMQMENDSSIETPAINSAPVIFKSSHIPDDDAMMRVADQQTVQGLIVNEIASISGEERKLLKEAYPNLDIDSAYILEHNRKPKGAGGTFGMMAGGGVLILLGIGLFVLPAVRNKS